VGWKYQFSEGGVDKVLVTETGTHAHAQELVDAAAANGVGYVLDGPHLCVTFNDAIRDRKIVPAAMPCVDRLRSITTVDPSRRHLHVIVRAKLRNGPVHVAATPWGGTLAVCDHGLVPFGTGAYVVGRPKVPKPAQRALNALLAELGAG
jgi:hypothetical protein